MLPFRSFINEELLLEAARVSSFSDEHAFKHMWNHGVNTGSHDEKHLTSEIEKAKKNPKHPLSVENNGSTGFKSGTDIHSPEAKEHYYNELHKAARTVAGLVKHPDFAKAAKAGHKAAVAGASRGELTPEWKSHGTTDKTSKADLHIGDVKNPHAIRVSYKDSGGSQLAAAGPEQTSATISHASHELLKDKKSGYTQKQHQEVLGHMKNLAKHMNAARDASNEEERGQSLTKAQAVHKKLMAVHPGLADHIAREAASGEGQFGKGSASSATHLVSTFNPKTNEVKVKKTGDMKAGDVAKMRLSKGKGMSGGKYRTHLLRMDLKS